MKTYQNEDFTGKLILLPRSIQIQTIDYCNRKCAWCPNAKIEKTPDNLMSEEIFTTILNQLSMVGYRGNLHLYLMAEPLCDPRICELIKMAREAFPENIIFISTNGDHLKEPDDIAKLLKSGLTWMAINNYDGNGRLEKLSKGFRNVTCPSVDHLKKNFYNRAGNIDIQCENPKEKCSWIFLKAYINYRGDVILCCSDYHYEVVFGNVMEKPFHEIYNSPQYGAYRKAHDNGFGRGMPLCERCNRIA